VPGASSASRPRHLRGVLELIEQKADGVRDRQPLRMLVSPRGTRPPPPRRAFLLTGRRRLARLRHDPASGLDARPSGPTHASRIRSTCRRPGAGRLPLRQRAARHHHPPECPLFDAGCSPRTPVAPAWSRAGPARPGSATSDGRGVPARPGPRTLLLADGSGGRLTHELVRDAFLPVLGNRCRTLKTTPPCCRSCRRGAGADHRRLSSSTRGVPGGTSAT